jgi:flagellar basal-body rod protein FlgB
MFSDPIYQNIERLMDLSAERQRLLSSNLANLDTPGYRARDLDFEAALSEALGKPGGFELARTDPRHVSGSGAPQRPQIVESADPARRDGNNVNLDREMAKMAETSLLFQAGGTIAQLKLRSLRNVITGGR